MSANSGEGRGDGMSDGFEGFAEIARLRVELDVVIQERDAAYLVHSNTKQLLEAVVKERDEALAQMAVLLDDLAHYGLHPSEEDCALCQTKVHISQKARALLTRLERAERVVEAASVILHSTRGGALLSGHIIKPSCPHGVSPKYPSHVWWCDDCWGALESALTT